MIQQEDSFTFSSTTLTITLFKTKHYPNIQEFVQSLIFTGPPCPKKEKLGLGVQRERCLRGKGALTLRLLHCMTFFPKAAHMFGVTCHPSQPCCCWRNATQAAVQANIPLTTTLSEVSFSLDGFGKAAASFHSLSQFCFTRWRLGYLSSWGTELRHQESSTPIRLKKNK